MSEIIKISKHVTPHNNFLKAPEGYEFGWIRYKICSKDEYLDWANVFRAFQNGWVIVQPNQGSINVTVEDFQTIRTDEWVNIAGKDLANMCLGIQCNGQILCIRKKRTELKKEWFPIRRPLDNNGIFRSSIPERGIPPCIERIHKDDKPEQT